jgi:hypothetical protein
LLIIFTIGFLLIGVGLTRPVWERGQEVGIGILRFALE